MHSARLCSGLGFSRPSRHGIDTALFGGSDGAGLSEEEELVRSPRQAGEAGPVTTGNKKKKKPGAKKKSKKRW